MIHKIFKEKIAFRRRSFNRRLLKNINVCSEAATKGVLWKKVLLEISQNSKKNTCAKVSIKLYLKRDSAQVFSCEFCEISINTFFTEHLWTTASVCFKRKSETTIISSDSWSSQLEEFWKVACIHKIFGKFPGKRLW